MGYTAQDENLFSNKIKVTLDRYDDLRKDYDNVILNYNGINLIIDNPTASAYPFLNEKRKDSSIPKEYRDKKYLSFKNESEVYKEFHDGEEGNFDVTKGFYKIVLIGAGSGGIAYGSTDKCGSRTGNGGAVLIFNAYFPSNGTLSYKVGLGSHGLVLSGGGIEHYGSDAGGNTEIFFNNTLIARACGGEKSTVFRRTKSKITIDDSYGGKYEIGSFVRSIEISLKGTNGWGEGMGNQNVHTTTPTYDVSPYNQYGVGGNAQATIASPFGNVTDGTNGYFSIISTSSIGDGYLLEGIDVESTKVHTLGNENEIRRKFDYALKNIYNRLSPYSYLIEDNCSELGMIPTTEEAELAHCEPYSEDVINNRPYNLSSVITTNDRGSINKNGTMKEDSYIITYDWNEKKKLQLSSYKSFLSNATVSNVYSAYIYNGDIIYIKDLELDTEIFKYINDEYVFIGMGRYEETEKILKFDSSNGDDEYNGITDGATLYITLVGAGGGGGGGSSADRWRTHGGAGGSGSYFKGTYHVFGNYTVKVGKGGIGGQGYNKGGAIGGTGSPSYLKVNDNIMVSANGGGGGQGSYKKNNYPPYPKNGTKGEVEILSYYGLMNVEANVSGNGSNETVAPWYGGISGLPSVYNGTNYGESGGSYSYQNGQNGKDGYVRLEVKEDRKLIYNGNVYKPYNGILPNSSIISWSDYNYDLEKLNRLKEYVASFDNWFDLDGYCQRSCQINCQTSVQKS